MYLLFHKGPETGYGTDLGNLKAQGKDGEGGKMH